MKQQQAKQAIADSLDRFASGSLAENAIDFFGTMGYVSEKRIELHPPTAANFRATFATNGDFNAAKALLDDWQSVDLLFQLTADEIRATSQLKLDLITHARVDDTIIESYLFFAIALQNDTYSRTQLATITREVNKLFKMPAILLFRHGHTLTLSIIDRRLHKRDPSRDVLKKVTLIKDIDFSDPHRAHIEILFDLSLEQAYHEHRFTNFVELHNAWRKILDTKELNKKFYQELANWYFWALKKVNFPADAEPDKETRNATSLIRLITRLIFVWFMKEKGLLPVELFNQNKAKQLLSSITPNESTYYKAILQNLFFATLNTEMNKDKPGSRNFRGTAKEPGQRDQHYMIHNVFRYEHHFVEAQDTFEKYFDNIPFLNGGLFECLDREEGEDGATKTARIDGFSDRSDNVLSVPNELFFSPEQDVDLNDMYGTKNKRYTVRGIIDILSRYKFTIAENTPIEEEIALDPELLGRVFENLLASYNPETKTTARKQTGSYYTPREIVNYMVDESLIAYLESELKQKIPALQDMKDLSALLREVFAYTEKDHPFNQEEVAALVDVIDSIRILDPACGSGAFPMGILHKLIFILGKLDPNNECWKARQVAKASAIPDGAARDQALVEIGQAFANNEPDYARKLYLIQDCIYGVDIQPIAVQIAKLRFFISLLVDQTIDDARSNRGIIPLPNLETKFVAANSLISLERPAQIPLRNPAIDQKEKELAEVRKRHFTSRTPGTKAKYRHLDALLRAEISQLLKQHGFPRETTEKLAQWDPYDQNASAGFFDPEWMFSIQGGFDVVIANPPYDVLNVTEGHKISRRELVAFRQMPVYEVALGGKLNLFRLFLAQAFHLLKESGVVTYIIPFGFMCDSSSKRIREFVLKEKQIRFIEAFPERDDLNKRLFEAVKMSTCIVCVLNGNERLSFPVRTHYSRDISSNVPTVHLDIGTIESFDPVNLPIPLMTDSDLSIVMKICCDNLLRIGDIGNCYQGEVNLTFHKKYLCETQGAGMPMIKGAGIQRCLLPPRMSQGEIEFVDAKSFLKDNAGPKSKHHTYDRLVMQGITGVNERIRLKATIIDKNIFCAHSVNYILLKDASYSPYYILGILNSKFMNWYFKLFSTNSNVNSYEVNNFPIPMGGQSPLIDLVSKILDITKDEDYLTNDAKQAKVKEYERQIDRMVYDLYGLTPEEKAVVEDSYK